MNKLLAMMSCCDTLCGGTPDSSWTMCCISMAMRTSLFDIATHDVGVPSFAIFWRLMSNNPMMNNHIFHISAVVKPFAEMLALCCFVLMCLMLMCPPFCTTSYKHGKLTRCVLETCRIGVILPFSTLVIVTLLSSHIVRFIFIFAFYVPMSVFLA